MKKHILILALTVAFCIFLSENLFAQQEMRSQSGRINRWISTANDAFESGRYFKAFGYYDRAFRREAEGPVRMQLRERLGETQRRLNNPVEAVVYFRAVWDNGNRDNSFLMSYADVLLRTANYEKAEGLYQMLLRQDADNVLLQNRLASAQLGLAHSDTLDVIFRDQIRRQDGIATAFSQYGMVIVDGRLVFSSTKRVNPRLTDQRTGHGFSHLYQATMRPDSLVWEHPTPLSFNIWGDMINDGVFSWDPVNRIGYFQRCNDGNCGIFTTSLEDGVWSIPQRFDINGVGATNMVGHPAISPDGRRLIFTTRAPEGEGGSDLWMTTRVDRPMTAAARRRAAAASTANPATNRRAAAAATRQTQRAQAAPPPPAARRGRAAAPIITNPDWDVPVNLGSFVNTPGDEVFPVWINNQAIAFSSNGHVGFGGLDIYVAFADEDGNFTIVHHIGSPINSSFDDYTLVISPDIDHIFFSSSRYIGFGHSDRIYSFPKTAGVLDFQFNVIDVETTFPLANVTIAVCEIISGDTVDAENGLTENGANVERICEYLTTDSLGNANLLRQKTASAYNITFNKSRFFDEERSVTVNSAIEILPLRDVRRINVAMLRDTTYGEIDTIPTIEEIEQPLLAAEIDTVPTVEIEEDRPVLADEAPAVTWFYSANQVRGQELGELVATAIIRSDVFMVSHSQEATELVSPIVFNFNLDPEQFTLIGNPMPNISPLILTPEMDPKLTEPISVFIDSVTFTQMVLIRSATDFRITGNLDYTLGFTGVVIRDTETEALDLNLPVNYTRFTDVPISFTLFGLGIPEEEPVLAFVPEPEPIVETPIFSHRVSLIEEEVVNMDECMQPGMTPQEIIDCINRRRPPTHETTADTRFVINFQDRINDPNRRANLAVLPVDVECIECLMEPQWHPADEPLYISASDDKKTLRFTDNAGNVTYFDLAPNTRFQISVQNLVSDDIAFLPSHINPSDIIRTVTTRDFVIFECMPKLSEIGEEVFVNNIFFDFDRYDIIRDGHRELDRMIVIAVKNPHFLFEIVTHADERGSFAYNLALTERRMNSILDYLGRRGFDENRLITRAASHSEPLIRNAQTEAEHALNRRATIRLIDPNRYNYLGPDYEVYENCPLNRPGLWFRVQVAAFRQAPEFPLYLFSDFLNAAPEVELNYFLDHDGLFKFTMGDFQDVNEARRLNQRILDANRESYVVAFIDGQRITIAEALAIQRRWARN